MKENRKIFINTVIAGAVAMHSNISNAQNITEPKISAKDAIRPFIVQVPKKDLATLKRRISLTRWPDKETVHDQSQGIQLQKMQTLLQYWGSSYDWRKAEAKLNAFPQFVTNIDNIDIHYIHVRSKEPDALPLVICHGWPGSVFELLKIIEPLTNPTSYGGKSSDAFDVVIPSLPGYGFSGRPTETGWGPERMAVLMARLMKRLGYSRYVAQGGDWGAAITLMMSHQALPGLLAIHLNLVPAVPLDLAQTLNSGAAAPDNISARERNTFEVLRAAARKGFSAYNILMTARPQVVGYGLTDSPAGLAAWLLNHPGFAQWNFGEDSSQTLTRDDVLDNITLYWLSNTAVSAARLYWENGGRSPLVAAQWKTTEIKIPVTVTIFGEDAYRPPESWIRTAYPTLSYFNEVAKGGHFAAWEQPQLFVEELRSAFRSQH